MSRGRTDMHRLQELVRLHRMGLGAREVARSLRMSPNTERRYRLALSADGLLEGDAATLPELEVLKASVERQCPSTTPVQEASSLERWRPRIEALVRQGAGPRAIYDRLRMEHDDFDGSHSSVKRFVRRLRREHGPRPEDVAIPVETAPGEVAQVDFGYVGKLFDPERHVLRRAWVFVMVLGFSRHLFARVVFDQKASTWLALHVEAFSWFGGVPKVAVPDNLKSAVIRASFSIDGVTALNRSYRELARHYGLRIDPTPPYSPDKKGKVERGVRYVKSNFFAGREGADVTEVNRALDRWCIEVAGERVHGTTQHRPLALFAEQEQAALLPLPSTRFQLVEWCRAKVHRDCTVSFDRRLYSVPWRFVGRDVWLRASPTTVTVYCDDTRIADHSRRGPGWRSIDDAHLPEGRRDLRHRSRGYWEGRARRMGDDVGDFIRDVFDADDVLSQLRTVQAMVTHLEKYPPHRAQAACRRAAYFGNTSYGGLKNILARALDLEPLPSAVLPGHGALPAPRFARPLTDLLHLVPENYDEPH